MPWPQPTVSPVTAASCVSEPLPPKLPGDLAHGHSSHHAKGISGQQGFRGDPDLMYFPRLDPASGRLPGLAMTPARRVPGQRLGGRVRGDDPGSQMASGSG